MLKGKVDNVKQALVNVNKGRDKKSIENLVIMAVTLIVTVVAINYIWKDDKKAKTENKNMLQMDVVQNNISQTSNNDDLESKLTSVLSKINGVGEVKVLITYSQTNIINPIYNEDLQESVTEESDTEGGKRTISSTNNKKEVAYSDNNIITQSITSPQIQGAVIIAKGADNAKVKTDIIQAVAAATGLSTYKIQVFEMN